MRPLGVAWKARTPGRPKCALSWVMSKVLSPLSFEFQCMRNLQSLLRWQLWRRLHQINEQLIEPRQIQVGVNMNRLEFERRLIRRIPRERVSIRRPVTEVHIDVQLLFFGNDRRI